MKIRMIVLALIYSPMVLAQDSGFYEFIRYRDNDPFLFCTEGLKGLDKCWFPLDPGSGTYMYTGVCDEPNPDGRSWTFEDRDSLSQYQRVCPKAMQAGSWQGAGDGSNSPHPH
ncbi:hypothetical protein J2T07_002511 [Luteibacter jiangsuensis]|uniref:Uncharacterized protein n=1 Tax=Luteibacter jiangsuensis TaxID=637577 RepID=A0ABT9SZ83_9GAMM|nr:hypothetical protein [Luteibacter jiangsuensis]